MPSKGNVEDVGKSTTVSEMLAGGKLSTSVEDSILLASSYKDKDGNTQNRSAKSVIGILADGKNQEEKEKAVWRKRAKLAAILGFIGVIMAVGIQFSVNYVANEMTKETTSVDFGDGAALVANGGEKIMQVAPATSKLTLAHALVLDMDHLQQLDEVVYRYDDANGKDVRVAAKVLEVQRAQGKNESDVTVTIITQTHNKLVLSPHQSSPMLWLNGTSHEICGDAKCANFMINDPGLDVDTLNARLDVIFAKSGGKDRRLAWVKCAWEEREWITSKGFWKGWQAWKECDANNVWNQADFDAIKANDKIPDHCLVGKGLTGILCPAGTPKQTTCEDRRRRARRRRGVSVATTNNPNSELYCPETHCCPLVPTDCETNTHNRPQRLLSSATVSHAMTPRVT